MNIRNIAAFVTSLVVHLGILVGLWIIKVAVEEHLTELPVESVFAEDVTKVEEVEQVLDQDNRVAENMTSGGLVSTSQGAPAKSIKTTKPITVSDKIKDPKIRVTVADHAAVGDGELISDPGAGAVTGEIGAVVDGYGAALDRITHEIIRLLRKDKLLVVWLFDESESMKDDQREISAKFGEVYEELGIVQRKDKDLRSRNRRTGNTNTNAILLTSIVSYGKTQHELTESKKGVKGPTADINEIRTAIDKIPVDESGVENMCNSIGAAILKYRTLAARQKRKLVLVVVSDESGDDGKAVEDALKVAKSNRVPIYILGREATFGYPYARQRWQDPKYKLWHWIRINRGPETAYPECLQWNGLHARHDSFSSGFGAYEMTRLARETGGIFFVLPGEEENLTGPGAKEKRQFDALAMREYRPLLLSRTEYGRAVTGSKFRTTLWQVIVSLNPNKQDQLPAFDPQLNIRRHRYPLELPKFKEEAATQVTRALRGYGKLVTAIGMLEKIEPERAKEASTRWRANYDLARAQLATYRIRLFQYLLAMDRHANANPPPAPKKPKTTHWDVGWTKSMIEPDEAQYSRLKQFFKMKINREEYLALVRDEEKRARQLFAQVQQEHPGTPWARSAQHELGLGFGMRFYEAYWDPNYNRPDIKIPKF